MFSFRPTIFWLVPLCFGMVSCGILGSAGDGDNEAGDGTRPDRNVLAAPNATQPDNNVLPGSTDAGRSAGESSPSTTVAVDIVEPDPGGADDARDCAIVDPGRVQVQIENTGTATSNYAFTVRYLDATGSEAGSDLRFLNHLRAGEQARQVMIGTPPVEAVSCALDGVERFEVTRDPLALLRLTDCTIAGDAEEGQVPLQVSVVSGTDQTSDFAVAISLMAGSVRIGEERASITLEPGETKTIQAMAFAGEAADSCEVVSLEGFPTS